MKKYLIIYHQEDNDGVLSCAMFKYYLMNHLSVEESEIELLPASYNYLSTIQSTKAYEKWPEDFKHIIMTDISFNDTNMMIWLKTTFKDNFTWIDHHAPIIKESIAKNFDDVNGIRSSHDSAIYHTWTYLYDPFKEKEVPKTIRLLSAWDSWTYEREGIDAEYCRATNKGFTISSRLSVKWWMKHMDLVYGAVVDLDGEIYKIYKVGLQRIEEEDIANKELLVVNGDPTWTVNGIHAIMVVTTGQTSSYMFKSLKEDNPNKDSLQIGAVFKHCSNGKWTLSLYNIYDWNGDKTNPLYFHCGDYLKRKFNGGGHEGAAGCTIDIEQFYKMLKTKQI